MKYDAANWATINRLLEAALDLPENERSSWLDTLSPEHDLLRPTLRRLLKRAADVETRDFLESLPSLQVEFDDRSKSGQEIGDYRLIRELGLGGMGSVWLAERADGLIDRKVALKLPHRFFSAGFDERLARERQILAGLNHPNIAQLYDAGISDDGQPYLALEYVDGVPIDEYCDQRGLSTDARVRLFLDVVEAVSYAHGRLLVHRDLKPANILVSKQGEVRLLDFGVAKLLDDGFANETELTRESGRALTLAYASPEQISGEPLTVASDVYSLGVLLYMLLTGSLPYAVQRDTRAALEEAVLNEDPRLPSDTAEAKAVKRLLRGDLDTIILKTLSKEPDRRYITTHALSDDLRRHLAGYPVLAQRDSAAYRIQKFVRRHRVGVATTLVTVSALLAATAVTVKQSIEAEKQRDVALYEQQRSEATNEFMSLLLEGVSATGEGMTMTDLLERGTTMLERQYQEQPFLGALYQNVASRYLGIGQVDRALELLSRAERLAREENDVDVLANVLCQSGRVGLRLRGTAEAGVKEIEDAFELYETIAKPSSATRVQCIRAKQGALKFNEDYEGSIAIVRTTLDVLNASEAKSSMHTGVLLNDLAITYIQIGQFAEAEQAANEAIDLMRSSGRAETVGVQTLELNRSNLLAWMGEMSRAKEVRERLLKQIQELRGPEGVPPIHRLAYASSLVDLAQYEEALPILHEAREATEANGNPYLTAACDTFIGNVLVSIGKPEEATAYLDQAEEFASRTPDGRKRGLHNVALVRTKVQLAGGDFSGAEDTIGTVLDELGYPEKKEGNTIIGALTSATKVALAKGDGPGAVTLASDTLTVATDVARNPEHSAIVGRTLVLRAEAQQILGNVEDARLDLEKAITPLSNGLSADHPETLEAQAMLARLAPN